MPGARLPDRRPKRALHFQADDLGPGYLRVVLPAAAINWASDLRWEVATQMAVHTSVLGEADLVLGQRISTPAAWSLWEIATADHGPATLYETDDLITAVPHGNHASAHFHKPATQKIIRDSISRADALVVSTEPLAEELALLNPSVHVIPNHVNENFIRPAPRDPSANGKVVIGWAGGSSRLPDLKPYAAELARILRKLSAGTELHLLGWDYRSLFDHRARHTPWLGDVEDYLLALDFDVGLCFLRDTRFNRCKSAVKALDYASQGIPVLAPAVTPYKEYVAHGEWGLLYRDEKEFRSHLLDLVNDPDLRHEMGVKGIAFAHTQSEQARCHERVAIYEQVLASGGRRPPDSHEASAVQQLSTRDG